MKKDLRALKTRQALFNALITLATERHYTAITVSELTKVAQINRATFYKHFTSMQDLAMAFVEAEIKTLFHIMEPMASIRYRPGYERQMLTLVLKHIASRQHIYHLLMVKKHIPEFTARFMEVMRTRMVEHPQNHQQQRFLTLHIEPTIGSWYGSAALVGTISLWLDEGLPYTPEFLAEQIMRLNPFQ